MGGREYPLAGRVGQAAGEAVTARYFHVTPYVAWTDARARGDIDTILEGEL